MTEVFISYSHEDRDWAREFADALKHLGLDPWFDQYRIRAGESLTEALEKGLRESDVIVLLISPESAKKPWVFLEVGAALGMGKKVLDIVPGDFDLSQLPLPLRLRKYRIKRSPQATAEELVAETTELQTNSA